VAKDRIRIKEFFIDFDKLRKGTVGEAAVSIIYFKIRIYFGINIQKSADEHIFISVTVFGFVNSILVI
jgi:hypothetical protein